ncbi:Mfa1 family fimbria major subunit [Parabacteroides sp.]
MKLKSTLWALAFACAAVSCSDDLEDGPNKGNEIEGLEGERTFMKVSVNQGVATKATGGEEGDNQDGGEKNEYTVDDVTVVLYTDADGKALTKFSHDSKLVAAGYSTTSGMSASDEKWHSHMTTVEITVTDGSETFDGKTYGIIAVTNLGSADLLKNRIKASDINTGAKLANLLQKNAWTGSKASASKFIMSTHNDTYISSTAIMDKVTLRANATSDNAPEADVHVERLAAKVRIGQASNVTNFIYPAMRGGTEIAKVRLDNVALVNKLTSGSYLLKRVTADETKTDGTISDKPTNGDNYLGNETWSTTTANYVIDPWTRSKNEAGLATLTEKDAIAGNDITTTTGQTTTLSYDADFDETNYATLWNSVSSGAIDLAKNTAITGTTKALIDYTQENTTSAVMSKNGYSTGALFKATYFPKEYVATTTETENGVTKDIVKPIEVDYNGNESGNGYDGIDTKSAGITFYVYQGILYKDYEAIFNEFAWREQKSLESVENAKIYSYADFNEKTKIEAIKVIDFLNSPLAGTPDPFSYFKSLETTYMTKYDTNKNGILDEKEIETIGETKLVEADLFSTFIAVAENKAKIEAVINTYENGVCYYPYWIRHADNSKPTVMGIMEFGIVRNNIYDLAVTQINNWGLSGIDKPVPGDDDEKKDLKFIVKILVKNWVVRNNGNIIF